MLYISSGTGSILKACSYVAMASSYLPSVYSVTAFAERALTWSGSAFLTSGEGGFAASLGARAGAGAGAGAGAVFVSSVEL